MYLEFNFITCHQPDSGDIYAAIQQTVDAQMNPPIKNMGVKGIQHMAAEFLKWPVIIIEIGGTGVGCFRYMYFRLFKESAKVTKDNQLSKPAEGLARAGAMFSEIGLLFKDLERANDQVQRIQKASKMFRTVAEMEENLYSELSRIVNQAFCHIAYNNGLQPTLLRCAVKNG